MPSQLQSMIDIAFVTDEISLDAEEAFRVGFSWGVRIYEVRCLSAARVPHLSQADRSQVSKAIERGARIAALSPGIFKCDAGDRETVTRELHETLPDTCRLARAWNVPLVLVFGFLRGRGTDAADRAAEHLRTAAAIAEEFGVTIAVENEPGYLCDSGTNTAAILAAAGHPRLRANWDPANAYGAGEDPFPTGYDALRHAIANVHVKDTREGSHIACVPVGDGLIDWRGQLRAIARDRPVAHVTIETHCLPLLEMSRRNLDAVRALLAQEEGT